VAVPSLPIDCPSGDIGVASQLVDILDCTTIDGATVEALDPNGVPISGSAATTNSTNGSFFLCGPEGQPFTITATAAGYPTAYFAELAGASAQDVVQLGMLSNTSLSVVGGIVPGGVDPSKGMVVVKVSNTVNCDAQVAGWTLGITLPDGGNLPDGGYQMAYGGQAGLPQPGLTETSSAGAAIFYDIDPVLSDFFVITYQNPDAGACESTDPTLGFTGRIYVAGGAVSAFPVFLP
jgi:hypothetical protein